MSDKNRMTDERFSAIEQAVFRAESRMVRPFVDYNTFREVFGELKAMREERK